MIDTRLAECEARLTNTLSRIAHLEQENEELSDAADFMADMARMSDCEVKQLRISLRSLQGQLQLLFMDRGYEAKM